MLVTSGRLPQGVELALGRDSSLDAAPEAGGFFYIYDGVHMLDKWLCAFWD
jgi:hypothetical protein